MRVDPLSRLEKMVEQNRIPHLLLFHGDIGKMKEAAYLLIEKLEAKSDYSEIFCEGKIGLHSLASVKSFFEKANLKPRSSQYQLFIIHDAEKMLPSSSNALLKVLEEPPSSSIFILLTEFPERMLPTLLSRAWKLFFPKEKPSTLTPEQEKMLHFFKEGTRIEEIENFAKNWELRKKEKEKALLEELGDASSKEIEGALSLHFQAEFFSYLSSIADQWKELECPHEQLDKTLTLARTAYLRSMPLQAILETLFLSFDKLI